MLLCVLFLELLAASIRQHDNITCFRTAVNKHKISLYADDILLYLTNQQTLIFHVHSLVNHFSKISGYSINRQNQKFYLFKTYIGMLRIGTPLSK